jgi:hypothetical protein
MLFVTMPPTLAHGEDAKSPCTSQTEQQAYISESPLAGRLGTTPTQLLAVWGDRDDRINGSSKSVDFDGCGHALVNFSPDGFGYRIDVSPNRENPEIDIFEYHEGDWTFEEASVVVSSLIPIDSTTDGFETISRGPHGYAVGRFKSDTLRSTVSEAAWDYAGGSLGYGTFSVMMEFSSDRRDVFHIYIGFSAP